MAERLGRVTRAFQTFQEPDLERLFFRFAASEASNRCNSAAIGQIADLVIVAENQLPIFRQFFRIGIFVNAVDRRDEAILQFTRDRFVRREHELLDQLMRFVVLDPLEPDRLAFLVEDALSLPENRDRASRGRSVSGAEGTRVPRPCAGARPIGR